jgi:hypothetical protein
MNPFWLGNPAAIGQQTRAGQIIVAGSRGNGAPKRRRKATRKTAARRAPRSAAKRANRKGRARLVKGSAAAKAYMAKIRRKRR